MKLSTLLLALGTTTLGLIAQKLETQRPDPNKVMRVETAKDHLTVIELSDAVTMVAVGNRSAFTVERRENKVFVTPTYEGAKTNLFIWTSGGRYSYELVPAKDVDQMHFAIDQVASPIASSLPPVVTEEAAQKTAPLPAEMLTRAQPLLLAGERDTNGRVEVTLRDWYRSDNRIYLAYSLVNHTKVAYQASRPAAWRLKDAKAPQSLLSLTNHQLGEKLARSLKANNELPVEVLDANQVETVASGGQGLGWIVIGDPQVSSTESVAVLRLQFAADDKGAVDATVVLQPLAVPEVARVQPANE